MSTSTQAAPTKGFNPLRAALWAVQILLGLAFLMAGFMKATQPYEALSGQMAWVAAVHPMLVKFIGVSELAGGLGLILPSATRIAPWLTVWAAAGLVLVMVLAAGFHIYRGEFAAVPVNLVLGGLAAFVAWGRTRAPIAPRG